MMITPKSFRENRADTKSAAIEKCGNCECFAASPSIGRGSFQLSKTRDQEGPISSSTLRCTSAGSTTTYESGMLKRGSSKVATVPSRFIVTSVSSVQVLANLV